MNFEIVSLLDTSHLFLVKKVRNLFVLRRNSFWAGKGAPNFPSLYTSACRFRANVKFEYSLLLKSSEALPYTDSLTIRNLLSTGWKLPFTQHLSARYLTYKKMARIGIVLCNDSALGRQTLPPHLSITITVAISSTTATPPALYIQNTKSLSSTLR